VQALDLGARRGRGATAVLDQHRGADGAAYFDQGADRGPVGVQVHGIHEVGGERTVRRVAQAMGRADPLQAIDPMGENAPAADQIGPAQRQLGMARPEILDAGQDAVEVTQVALLDRAEAEPGDHPTAHNQAPLAMAHAGHSSMAGCGTLRASPTRAKMRAARAGV
jgi:hypothetical protein